MINYDVERYNKNKLLNKVYFNEYTFNYMTFGRKQEQYL